MSYRSLALGLFILLPSTVLAQSVEEVALGDLFQEQFIAYWQAADAEGLATLWHEDGDWMSLIGSRRIREGRAEIEQVWRVGLQGRDTAAQRALRIDIDAIKVLTPNLAHVDLVMTFGEEGTGVVREAMLAVLQKDERGWKIISSRVARLSAQPSRR